MLEQSKSAKRRFNDGNFHNQYFKGNGIDIGGAPDPFSQYIGVFPLVKSVQIWDLEDGDAQFMLNCRDETYDFVVSSHCLEHMRDVYVAFENWIRIVKKGGYLIITIPDEDMYEQGEFPSKYNGDHKWTFTIHKRKSWSKKSINILSLLEKFSDSIEIIKIQKIEDFYYKGLKYKDQTLHPNVESSIELILQRRSDHIEKKSNRLWCVNERAIEPNSKLDFSKSFSLLYKNIELLKNKSKKYLIYGEGTLGKTIKQILQNDFVAFIDNKSSKESIQNLTYDYIIIGVLGREKDSIKFIFEKLSIEKKYIITLELN